MASTTPTFLCSSTQTKSALFTISLSLTPKPPKLRSYTSVPQLGIRLSSQWSGLRHMSVSIRHKIVKFERKGRCRGGKGVVFASLFGVGAPEALVIGVVALLVFGPKGLAEVARNLGKTLRAFQPTIRELQDVSREFKSTLEREIGLDENPPSMQSTYKSPTADTSTTTTTNTSPSSDVNNENSQAVIDPNSTPPTKTPYSSEEYLKITEEQLKANAVQQETPFQDNQPELQPQPQDGGAPPEKPFNIGEILMEAQIRSTTSQQQGQTSAQKDESEPQPQPQATMPQAKKPESEV